MLTAVVDGELVFGTHADAAAARAVGDRRPGRHPLGGPVGDPGGSADQDAGRALCEALLAWGAARGATRGYVRVLDGDHAAAGLAYSLGFALHHRARYVDGDAS